MLKVKHDEEKKLASKYNVNLTKLSIQMILLLELRTTSVTKVDS